MFSTDVIFKFLIGVKTVYVQETFAFELINKPEKLKILLSYPTKININARNLGVTLLTGIFHKLEIHS